MKSEIWLITILFFKISGGFFRVGSERQQRQRCSAIRRDRWLGNPCWANSPLPRLCPRSRSPWLYVDKLGNRKRVASRNRYFDYLSMFQGADSISLIAPQILHVKAIVEDDAQASRISASSPTTALQLQSRLLRFWHSELARLLTTIDLLL